MNLNETRNRIKTTIWQAIAKGDIDLAAVPKASLEPLVELVTNTAVIEMDNYLDTITPPKKDVPADIDDAPKTDNGDIGEEEVLWKGRPFLSLTVEYVITSERVRIFEGLLSKSREDVELVRIQDIDQNQAFSERLLNLGDITIRSSDASHPLIVLNNVRDPQAVHEILRRAVLKAREKRRLVYREEM